MPPSPHRHRPRQLRATLEAAGKADALQSVDENDEDGEEEDADDEEQEEDAQWQEPPAGGAGDQGGLEAALAAMSIAE